MTECNVRTNSEVCYFFAISPYSEIPRDSPIPFMEKTCSLSSKFIGVLIELMNHCRDVTRMSTIFYVVAHNYLGIARKVSKRIWQWRCLGYLSSFLECDSYSHGEVVEHTHCLDLAGQNSITRLVKAPCDKEASSTWRQDDGIKMGTGCHWSSSLRPQLSAHRRTISS